MWRTGHTGLGVEPGGGYADTAERRGWADRPEARDRAGPGLGIGWRSSRLRARRAGSPGTCGGCNAHPALGRDPSGAGWRPPSTSPRGAGPTCCSRCRSRSPSWRWPGTGSTPQGWPPRCRSFAALAQVQDKVSAFRTLALWLGCRSRPRWWRPPRPRSRRPAWNRPGRGRTGWPLFVKMPIGTASAGVRRAWAGQASCGRSLRTTSGSGRGPEGVLVQQPVTGPLAMVQAAFARGELVAFDARRAGPRGRSQWGQPGASGWGRRRRGSTGPGRARRWVGTARCPRGMRATAWTACGSSISTLGSSSRSTPWPAAPTWPGRWSRWPGPRPGQARSSRSRPRARGADDQPLFAARRGPQGGRRDAARELVQAAPHRGETGRPGGATTGRGDPRLRRPSR